MGFHGTQPLQALRLRVRLGPWRVPVWAFTLAVMLLAAVAGQAMGPLAGKHDNGGSSPAPQNGAPPGAPQVTPPGLPILSPPMVRQKSADPGGTTTVEFRNAGRECDLRVEMIQLAPQGYVESSRINRYVDTSCDRRVDSVSYGGFYDRDAKSEAFFQDRDREYADWLQRLGLR